MSLVEEQLELLHGSFPDASATPLPEGGHIVTVPAVKLLEGWSERETTVRFILLANYPHSAPDCFWAEHKLRLANNSMPRNTNIQVMPGTNENWLWFSWHASRWSPNRDSLSTYVKVIESRFRDPQ
jgi:hypothetical protein